MIQSDDLWTKKVTLEGKHLKLEPLHLSHLDDLAKHLITPHAWHCVHWDIKSTTELKTRLEKSMDAQTAGSCNIFSMVIKSTGQVVGNSCYMAINRASLFLEIGATWIGAKWHRTFVNTEAKYLMLSYAFETLGCQRVEFRADAFNFNSQRAIRRLGAKYEGELRNACRLPDGRLRDYRVYSIIGSEWLNIKKQLEWNMEKYSNQNLPNNSQSIYNI